MFAGMSDGGSIAAVAEGEGVGSEASSCALVFWVEAFAGLGEDCAQTIVAETCDDQHKKRRKEEISSRQRRPAIGVTGFEPATSWSQTRRSTKLSYTPRILPDST